MELKYKIYVINMDRSPDRLADIKAQLSKFDLDFKRIVGVEVSKISVGELEGRYSIAKSISDFYRPLNLGEIGCYISHQDAWRQLVEDDLDFAIVLEDDITVKDNIRQAIAFMLEHSDKWNLLRIQSERKRKAFYNVDYKGDDFSVVEYVKSSGGAFGYAIKKDTAKLLLEKLVPFGITADTNMHIFDKYGVEVKGLRPYAIGRGREFVSEIATFKPKKRIKFSVFARKIFSVKSYCVRLKYLLCRDGFIKFSLRCLKMPFSKKTRD